MMISFSDPTRHMSFNFKLFFLNSLTEYITCEAGVLSSLHNTTHRIYYLANFSVIII